MLNIVNANKRKNKLNRAVQEMADTVVNKQQRLLEEQQDELLNASKGTPVFLSTAKVKRNKQIHEDKLNYDNAVTRTIAAIIQESIPGGENLDEEAVIHEMKNFMKTIEPLMESNPDVFKMPLLANHNRNISIGMAADLGSIVKQSAHANVVAMKQSHGYADVSSGFGINNAYNNIDITSNVGGSSVAFNQLIRGSAKSLSEQVSPTIKSRVLGMFNEEKKLQESKKEDESMLLSMALSEDFSAAEITTLRKKMNRKNALTPESLFECVFKLNTLLHEDSKASNEEILQETIFNLSCLEVFNELGMLKEGINPVVELRRIRTKLASKQ